MPPSDIVESKYRIHADDLNGQTHEWIIANVSFQGLEDMAPVLHIEGATKRFVLDQEQSRQMMSLTHTVMPDEWIGAKIRVAPAAGADDAKIVITAADLPGKRWRWSIPAVRQLRLSRLVIGAVLLIAIITLAYAFSAYLPTF